MLKKLSWLLLAIIPLMTGSVFAEDPLFLPDGKTKLEFDLRGESYIAHNGEGLVIITSIIFPEENVPSEPAQKIILGNALIGAVNAVENDPGKIIENFWVPSDFNVNNAMKENAIDANTLIFSFESLAFKNAEAKANNDFSQTISTSLLQNIDFDTAEYVRAKTNIRGMSITGPIIEFDSGDEVSTKKMQAAYALIGQVIASRKAWFTGVWDGRASLRIPDSSLLFDRRSGDDATRGTFLGRATDLVDYTGTSSDGTVQFRAVLENLIEFLKKIMVPIAIILISYSGVELFLSFQNDERMDKKIRSLTGTLVGFLTMMLAVNFVDWVVFGNEGQILRGGGVDPAEFAKRGFEEVSGLFDLFTSFAVIIAVGFIVYNAITLIMAGGEDEGQIGEIKKRILYSIIGLVLLISVRPIIDAFTVNGELTMPNVRGTVAIVAKWLNFILGFIGVFAVVSMIYAGIQMIIHFGDDTQIENAKKIMTSAGIGLLLAFSSWVIVYYFIFAG